MTKMSAIFLGISVLFTACKKTSPASSTMAVEYQVTATNSSGIAISYNNVLEQKVLVNAQNSWVFDVTVGQKPFHAYIQASSTSPFSSVTSVCTVSILVNGNIVKTATVSSNTVAVAEAAYTVQ
ncbi:MAG: hypothetical protein NVSMB7_08670 [Chitinophagaceae bacterium]